MKHRFISTVADGTTVTDVQPGDWNDDHLSAVGGTTASVPEILSRVFAVGSSNSSAAVNLINYNVPARALGTNRMLRFTAGGDVLAGTTAVANNFQLEVKEGGSSRWKDTNSTQAAVATLAPWQMSVLVAALNSSGSRTLRGSFVQSSQAAGGFGLGDLTAAAAAPIRHFSYFGSSATYTITTGVVENFNVVFNWVAANSSLSFNMRYGILELV